MFKKVDNRKNLPEVEHEIIEYWRKNNIFKKSVEKNKENQKYVFFDGPPFANGLPHYGHIMANSLKDAVTRYWNMKGFFVPRTNGWDCHGLPVEYEIEKSLNISGKKEIEKFGIDNFNLQCKESVFKYSSEWAKLFERIGRWVDFEQTYATLENSYMESIWWVFKSIWDKEMVYKSYKSMHICPRCVTPLSNFEVSQGYKDVTDLSVTAKFELLDEKNTFILAWTTTPWTLPGNTALAVGKNIDYIKIKSGENFYILAKELLEKVMKDKEFEVIESFKGENLENKKYKPLFDYFINKDVENIENSYRVILADFVSIEDGTGIVHIAPSFGEDDLNAGKVNKLAFIKHVDMEGNFTSEVTDFAGKFVKGQDQNIADYLIKKGFLFSKESYRHSYPHCWRCDTPLLNYATGSWFIKVSEIIEKLLENNQKISWQPPHIKDGRFGKWLENARDWAISRNRYWGAAIPIWECKSCGECKCIGSIDELSENEKTSIHFYMARHGEYEGTLNNTIHSDPSVKLGLTENGIKQAEKLADEIKNEKIDVVISSELLRSQETASILAKKFNLDVIVSPLINEMHFGEYDSKHVTEHQNLFNSSKELIEKKISPEIENLQDIVERMKKFVQYVKNTYKGKKVLIVSHGTPLMALEVALGRITIENAAYKVRNGKLMKNCEYKKFVIGNEPIDNVGELDLHKPYIDNVILTCEKCGDKMHRISEVFDCWFESGAMPYAQLHYPFENKSEFEENFPAHFIAEGLDQTRGWFYTLHVLSTILFDKPAFNNVIVNGILLAADGEKLSKRKKNYPDPNDLFESRGVDAVRYFLYTSTAPLAEDVRFSEKHVEEVVKKTILTLWNTYSFFVTYANIDNWNTEKFNLKATNKLDKWIISELQTLIQGVSKYMDEYNLTQAARLFTDFIDNLSNWYVRRSRRRFWKSENDDDKNEAYSILYYVLLNLAKLMAPFTPFISEEIFTNLTGKESVHMENWPEADNKLIDLNLNEEIAIMRKIVELGHRCRANAKVKVRQPLNKLIVALPEFEKFHLDVDVLKEELNIKNIEFINKATEIAKPSVKINFRVVGERLKEKMKSLIEAVNMSNYEILEDGKIKISDEILDPSLDEATIVFTASKGSQHMEISGEKGLVVALDTNITEILKKEGIARDIIRYTQELRKEADYNVDDRIYLYLESKDLQNVISEFAEFIMKETLALEIQQKGNFEWDLEKEEQIDKNKILIAVRNVK
ncbi:MAG: isoleucyl-tRNA synthetase, isoleucyl-tRNA synthetase [Candidatus Peregrinibacteria bacterium GW2011_GWC2_33_13]|nr:MAG: isoleucyl-tRNA synthetase, isoleucyl-tRNA synthetase [Candidatus Peregrinibacteria bacterium GW2011_GWC2_33_13]